MRVLSLVILFALSACGGGGGDGASEPASPPLQTAPTAITAFGDSTQAGFTPPSTYTPPSAVAAQILGITIENQGRSGTSSQQLLDGTDGSGQPWADRIASAHVVLINHGINDNQRTDAEYRASLTALVKSAQAAGKMVVLETPNPIVAGGSVSAFYSPQSHDAKVQVMRDVATQTGALLCDEYAAIRSQSFDTLAFIPDGVHPSPALYTFKGQVLADCLRPLRLAS